MAFKGETKENRTYLIIAILVFIVIIITVIFSSNQLTPAYIAEEDLINDWAEDVSGKSGGSQTLGLEKWTSFRYIVNDSRPASLTIITYKILFMWTEEQLLDILVEKIENDFSEDIIIDSKSKITGERSISTGHGTQYVVYNGNDTSKQIPEKIKIIGETWNCQQSGTSIFCIGVAQLTDNSNENSDIVYSHWSDIVRDKQGSLGYQSSEGGLIFNVVCHQS